MVAATAAIKNVSASGARIPDRRGGPGPGNADLGERSGQDPRPGVLGHPSRDQRATIRNVISARLMFPTVPRAAQLSGLEEESDGHDDHCCAEQQASNGSALASLRSE